jgi:hypothetical protein
MVVSPWYLWNDIIVDFVVSFELIGWWVPVPRLLPFALPGQLLSRGRRARARLFW